VINVDLIDWAKKHKMYLKLEEDEPVVCKFLGYEEFVDHDNDDKDKIRYFLEVGGDEKVLESQSISLAEEMGKFKKGDFVKITRTGKGRNTRYEVKGMPSPDVELSKKDLEDVDKALSKDEFF